MSNNHYNILDLFSGAGGFSLGFDMVSGYKTAIAVDYDINALNTFQNNFPDTTCIQGDICDKNIKNQIIDECKKKSVNMIIGGPPCQGFSLKGKNLGVNDQRNYLFLEYLEIVKAIKPKVFVIENVKNMLVSGKGFFINQIKSLFSEIGYSLDYGILNSVNYGVPQTRERTIIIGVLGNKGISLPTNTLNTPYTVRDAISDLSYLESGEGGDISTYITKSNTKYQKQMRNNSKLLYNHKATNHSPLAIKKMNMIPAEADKSFLPKELHGKQQHKTTWSRLIWDKPSPTIDTRFDTPSNGRNTHPILNRSITPREAARLQSFPDTFIFYGNKTSICRQIGNAVPPLMAKGIAKHIIKENI